MHHISGSQAVGVIVVPHIVAKLVGETSKESIHGQPIIVFGILPCRPADLVEGFSLGLQSLRASSGITASRSGASARP